RSGVFVRDWQRGQTDRLIVSVAASFPDGPRRLPQRPDALLRGADGGADPLGDGPPERRQAGGPSQGRRYVDGLRSTRRRRNEASDNKRPAETPAVCVLNQGARLLWRGPLVF